MSHLQRAHSPARRPDMGEVLHEGEYLEIDRPRRLVFTFAVPAFDPTATTLALSFAAADGGCRLTLRHTEVLPGWVEPTRQGWEMILASLEAAL
ncbi:MAG TPA: SRPBCC family protein [Phenylobacterium sp.]|nr:SRPBCC family protein [Phenylobacterium sp.]